MELACLDSNKKLENLSVFLAKISCGEYKMNINDKNSEFAFRRKRRKRSLLVKVISCDREIVKPTARFIYNLLTSPRETISDTKEKYEDFIMKSTFPIFDCGFRFNNRYFDWWLNFMFFCISISQDWQFYLLGCPMASYMFQSLINDENSRHNLLRILVTVVIEGVKSSDALSFVPSINGISLIELKTFENSTCSTDVLDKHLHIFLQITILCINMAATKAVSKGITLGLMSKTNFKKIDEIIDRATKSIMG
jgi:hypothetical protein